METRRCSLPKIHILRDSRPFPKTLTTVDGAGARVSLSHLAHPVPWQEAFILLPTRSSLEGPRPGQLGNLHQRKTSALGPGRPSQGRAWTARGPWAGKRPLAEPSRHPLHPCGVLPRKTTRPGPAPAATWGGWASQERTCVRWP